VVLASMTDVGQRKVLAVRRGLRSLLRRTRSRQGRRRIAPLSCCAALAAVLVPPASLAQPPKPDPPPPGLRGSQPTRLDPDARPGSTRTVPPAPPAPVEESVPEAVEETTAPVVETPQPETTPPAPQPTVKRAAPRRVDPVGRQFTLEAKLSRWDPRVATTSLAQFSSDPDSRPYLVAALSLAVLALGSGTLLTVLARLRSTRQGLA
jgi:hypothetical protein